MKVDRVPIEVWHDDNEGRALAQVCIPLLRKAERYASGRFKAEDLIINCVSGESDCWIGYEDDDLRMVGVTTVRQYPRKNNLCIDTVGAEIGYLNQWVGPAVEALTNYCNELGLDMIEILAGRKGWSRVLLNHGFISKLSVFEVDLCRSEAGKLPKSNP
jgi:hypothetical protein